MADRIISAEAVISAKDATGDIFTRIAAKAQNLGKGMNFSPQVERLSKSLEDAQRKMAAIDRLNVARGGLSQARTKFIEAQAAVQNAARAMASAEKPAAQLTSRYAAAQRAVAQASAAFEKQASIAKSAKHALEGLGIPINKAASEQTRLKGSIDATTHAIERQIAADKKAASTRAATLSAQHAAERLHERRLEGVRHHGIVNYALGAAAGYAGAHGVMRGVEYSLEKGAERQHARVSALNAGISPDEVDRMEKAAIAARSGAPLLSTSQIMELHKEARSAVQHPEEAFHLIPDLSKAASVLKGMGVQNANIADIVKAGESLGLMNDPKRFHRYLEGQVKAMAVMGKTISTEQVYEAAKYSKSAGATLSDDFINLTLPSLIQEMHGSSAGDALSMLTKTFRGGLQHKHLPVDRLNKLGLLEDPSKIRRAKKTGQIMGYQGLVKGDALLASDPGKWFQDVFNPAAEKAGFKTLADKVKLLSEVLPSTAANLGRIFLQQEETLKQHRRNYEAAPGLDGMVENQRNDPKAGMKAIRESLDDLASSVTGPGMLNAAKGISHLAEGIRTLSAAAERYPKTAMATGAVVAGGALTGAGVLAYQLSQGFGLRGSAMALNGAAASLQRAALGLQGSRVPVGTPVGGLPGVPVGTPGVVAGAAGFAAGAVTLATIGGAAWLIRASHAAQQPGQGGQWAPATLGTADEDALHQQDDRERASALRARIARARGSNKLGGFDPVRDQMERQLADLENQIEQRRKSLRAIHHLDVPKFTTLGTGGMHVADLPQVPLYSIAPGSKTLPTFASGGIQTGPFPGANMPSQKIDVTGKVGAEVTSHVDAKVQVSITAPQGITATVTNTTVVAKPGKGVSMKGARGTPGYDSFL